VNVAFNGGAPEDSGRTSTWAPTGPGAEFDGQTWHIVREKEHPTEPMTVDALLQMEMVGHHFFLFIGQGVRAAQRHVSATRV
jgi:hypothetical protein